MRDHAYKQGCAVYEAIGATVTYPTPPYPSTHNMGTNRMSEKARDGVVNKFGQTHDVKNLFVSDGSQFTSSAACNPTLTIVALADPAGGSYRRRHAAKGNLAPARFRPNMSCRFIRDAPSPAHPGMTRMTEALDQLIGSGYSAATSLGAAPSRKSGTTAAAFDR